MKKFDFDQFYLRIEVSIVHEFFWPTGKNIELWWEFSINKKGNKW